MQRPGKMSGEQSSMPRPSTLPAETPFPAVRHLPNLPTEVTRTYDMPPMRSF